MPSNMLQIAKKNKRTVLTEVESKQLIAEAGIPVIATKLAKNKSDAIAISRELGFPVALKIVSPDIIHKSDAGCVKLNVPNSTQVGIAYSQIISNAKKDNPNRKLFS